MQRRFGKVSREFLKQTLDKKLLPQMKYKREDIELDGALSWRALNRTQVGVLLETCKYAILHTARSQHRHARRVDVGQTYDRGGTEDRVRLCVQSETEHMRSAGIGAGRRSVGCVEGVTDEE